MQPSAEKPGAEAGCLQYRLELGELIPFEGTLSLESRRRRRGWRGKASLPPWLSRVGTAQWFDERLRRFVATEEIEAMYFGPLDDELAQSPEIHPKVTEFLSQLPKVKFIRADRLFVRSDVSFRGSDDAPSPTLMVEHLSKDLREQVRRVDREYRMVSTELDSSLRRRLFEKPKGEPPAVDELRRRNADLDEQERKLVEMGLLREQPDGPGADLPPGDLGVLAQHLVLLEDREKKLAVFSTIVAKAQRLLESLNSKLAPKKVRLQVETGYEVLTPARGRIDGAARSEDSFARLPLNALSSGEQHELVLLHELLFDVEPGSLILIDEPELSLHVTWQVDMLPELLDIAQLSELTFVLATHSPYIVNEHNDLMVRLGEPV
jgi:hypothetical protein